MSPSVGACTEYALLEVPLLFAISYPCGFFTNFYLPLLAFTTFCWWVFVNVAELVSVVD
jgi:hypothetical protein